MISIRRFAFCNTFTRIHVCCIRFHPHFDAKVSGIDWRLIGPFGRARVAIAVSRAANVFYMATNNGGV